MHARVTFATVRRETYEVALRLFRETTVPLARAFPGNRGILMFGNRADLRMMTVSLWDTESDLRESGVNQAMLENVALFGPLIEGGFLRDQYEVVTDTWERGRASLEGEPEFARATTTQLRSDRLAEGIELVREITGRAAGEPRQFHGSLALVVPSSGKVLALEVWNSRSALASYDASVYLHDRMARERQVLETPPAHEVFRVVVSG